MLLLLTCVLGMAVGQQLEKPRSVWVEQGLVRGNIYKIDEKHMQIFRGIPYAEPPVDKLRFQVLRSCRFCKEDGEGELQKPVKKKPWHQEKVAVEYGPPCIQFMDFHRTDRFSAENMEQESEDCLFLNVFSPYNSEDEGKLYPIMVWIHGGSFLAGSGDTGIDMEVVARNIVFKGVTLVTLNYRLGPLGFVSYTNEAGQVEGNFGIWDQVMALQWIQSNIRQFNGDPSRVTVMGESAGAAAASVLAVSPKTIGLVHQAIVMSGSATAGWAIHRHGPPSWSITNLASYLRCEKSFSEEEIAELLLKQLSEAELRQKKCNLQDELLPCLQAGELSNTELLECLQKELNFSSFLFRKGLSVELGVSKMIVDNDLVPASGRQLIEENARVPLLIGVARREWAHKRPHFYNFARFAELTRAEAEEAVYRIIESAFHLGVGERLPNATLQLISNASFVRYLEDPSNTFHMSRVVSALQEVPSIFINPENRLLQLEADIEFVAPCQKEIDAYAAKGLPVYAYSFDYVPQSQISEEEKRYYKLFGSKAIQVRRVDRPYEGLCVSITVSEVIDKALAAFHGLDHAFIFTRGYSSNFEIEPYTEKDMVLSRLLTNMITNFARSGDPSTKHFTWPPFTNGTAQYTSIDLPPKILKGDVHWPAPKFWNVEAELLTKYVLKGDGSVSAYPDAELTNEERVQLGAYRRAWWALWLLVAALGIVIWGLVIYFVVRKGRSPRSKPYDNIVVNR